MNKNTAIFVFWIKTLKNIQKKYEWITVELGMDDFVCSDTTLVVQTVVSQADKEAWHVCVSVIFAPMQY